LHAIQKTYSPTMVVKSTTLHGATPLNKVMLIAKVESMLSKEFTINFGK